MIISGLSGRLDHTFNNLNLLYKYSEKFEISLFEEESLLTIITPGITTYKINRSRFKQQLFEANAQKNQLGTFRHR